MKKIINCTQCDKVLEGRQTMYCSTRCKNNNHQSYHAQKSRGLKRKIDVVLQFGGRCKLCGYKRNISALTFHHINPKEKSFKLDMRSLSNRKNDQIKEELKKCILLCHNCHSEIHYPQHNLVESTLKPTALTPELQAHISRNKR